MGRVQQSGRARSKVRKTLRDARWTIDLDALDWQIISYLRRDGRLPFRELARLLGVAEGTIRNRVNGLTESGFIRIIAVANPISLGVPILATTYARIRPDRVEWFCDLIEQHPRVIYLGVGVGHKNVVFESTHADLRDLYSFTQSCLHIPEVLEYDTVQVLDIRKSVWDWSTLNPYATSGLPLERQPTDPAPDEEPSPA